MIPYKHLLREPENYKPLGSVKAVRNYPSKPSYERVDIIKLFLFEPNLQMVAESIYRVARSVGSKVTLHKVSAMLPAISQEFLLRNDIKSFALVESGVTGVVDWVEILRAVNNKFIKFCYNYIKWNQFVPFREWVSVGDSENRYEKPMHDLLADDIPTIDVWQHQEINRDNESFRDNNRLPFYQQTMCNRFYDSSNDGLRNDTSDRASLETPIYGYNMGEIYQSSEKWKDSNYFG